MKKSYILTIFMINLPFSGHLWNQKYLFWHMLIGGYCRNEGVFACGGYALGVRQKSKAPYPAENFPAVWPQFSRAIPGEKRPGKTNVFFVK